MWLLVGKKKKFTVCCRFSSKNYFVRSKYHVAQKGVPYQISWCPKNYFTRHDTKISFCFVIQKYHVMIQNYHFVLSKYHVAQKKREILLIPKKFCVRVLMGSPEVWNRCFAVCLTFDLLCYYLWPVVCSWIVCFAAPLVCCLLVSVTLGVTQGFRPTRHCCLIFVFFRGHWCFVFLKRRSLTFSDSTCLDYAGILSAKN